MQGLFYFSRSVYVFDLDCGSFYFFIFVLAFCNWIFFPTAQIVWSGLTAALDHRIIE